MHNVFNYYPITT